MAEDGRGRSGRRGRPGARRAFGGRGRRPPPGARRLAAAPAPAVPAPRPGRCTWPTAATGRSPAWTAPPRAPAAPRWPPAPRRRTWCPARTGACSCSPRGEHEGALTRIARSERADAGWTARPLPLAPGARDVRLAGDGGRYAVAVYRVLGVGGGLGCRLALVDLLGGQVERAHALCAGDDVPVGVTVEATAAGPVAHVALARRGLRAAFPAPRPGAGSRRWTRGPAPRWAADRSRASPARSPWGPRPTAPGRGSTAWRGSGPGRPTTRAPTTTRRPNGGASCGSTPRRSRWSGSTPSPNSPAGWWWTPAGPTPTSSRGRAPGAPRPVRCCTSTSPPGRPANSGAGRRPAAWRSPPTASTSPTPRATA